MEKKILVYENFSSDTPLKLGVLYVNELRGTEYYSFQYDDNWLTQTNFRYHLDPELSTYSGRQYPINQIFGIFADSSPDRWGRVLIKRREAIEAKKEDRKPRKLNDSDYLLGVYDETRMGAIRYKENEDGASPSDDLTELWKRIVFYMAISNTDDHLRNHGFLLTTKGWRLSPLYDVNPVPYGDTLSLNVNDYDNSISIELAIETSKYFDINTDDANVFVEKILSIVKNNWESIANKYGISHAKIEEMRPAFDACYR